MSFGIIAVDGNSVMEFPSNMRVCSCVSRLEIEGGIDVIPSPSNCRCVRLVKRPSSAGMVDDALRPPLPPTVSLVSRVRRPTSDGMWEKLLPVISSIFTFVRRTSCGQTLSVN